MARSSAVRSGPTINDIAGRLGVHKSTVSRAMDPRRRHLVAGPLLERIEATARDLGWRPNATAAALSTGRTRTVGVLLPDITNPVFPPILRGIEDTLQAHGYFALLANTAQTRPDASGHDLTEVAVQRLLAQPVDGLIIATAQRTDDWLDTLHARGVPLVLVNRTRARRAGAAALPSVVSDDALGMQLAVEHLLGLGHRRLVHLAGPAAFSTGRDRRVGFERTLQRAGIEPVAVLPCQSYSIEAGRAALQAWLVTAPPDRFTGVVAANDLLALGAVAALQAAGWSVPRQVSVVGHNDMPFLDQMSPPLTSVRIALQAMGEQAAAMLMQLLDGQKPAPARRVLAPSLVVRGSSAAPPGA